MLVVHVTQSSASSHFQPLALVDTLMGGDDQATPGSPDWCQQHLYALQVLVLLCIQSSITARGLTSIEGHKIPAISANERPSSGKVGVLCLRLALLEYLLRRTSTEDGGAVCSSQYSVVLRITLCSSEWLQRSPAGK